MTMAQYSVSSEASRILNDVLLSDSRLGLPPSFSEASKKVQFVNGDAQVFLPTPFKMAESASALTALLGAAASVVAAARYGIEYQDIEVNTDIATLFLESVSLPTINGKPFSQHEQMLKVLKKMDIHDMTKPIRRYATNIYQTKDGRWYHLHGSMNADPTMKMMGVHDSDVSPEEAIKTYAEVVARWDSREIEKVANEEFRQAGVLCYTPEEFFASEHGQVMSKEPLWNMKKLKGPRKAWPEAAGSSAGLKPLHSIRVIDFSRVIAAPAVSKMLAVLGADVIRISNSKLPDYASTMMDLQTGKRDANIDLKTAEGKESFVKLVEGADILIDGYRPGALKSLGFDSHTLRKLNPSLIYIRENCYGFKGPLAHRSGWQQISDCLVGLSWLQGKFLGFDEAVVPLFPNSDYQTGLVGAVAAIQALVARTKDDCTFDIDLSLTQYNIWLYRLGIYTAEQRKQLRARYPDFSPRHFDDMRTLVAKTHAAIKKSRPDIFEHPEYFWRMSLKEYGFSNGEEAMVLAPAFKLGRSKLEYVEPSGRRGRSTATWIS